MENDSDNFSRLFFKILLIIFLLLAILLLCYLVYVIYLDIPRAPEKLNVILNNPETKITNNNRVENLSFLKVRQFHQNMKFNHNTISYSISPNCDEIKRQEMLQAFTYLSQKVPEIKFYGTVANPDIDIICSKLEKPSDEMDSKDFFIAGEGGAKEIIQSGEYNIITNGTISLFQSPEGAIECNFPNVEIHELMHVFGFDHSEDKKSLMNPLLNSCDQVLDPDIITQLKELYSKKNHPDLYFEDVKAVKKGRYLDFNVTIKNIGLENAKSIEFIVIDDGEIIEEKLIENINFGAGVVFKVENLKLTHLEPKEIQFVIDMNNLIEEMDERNNIAVIKLVNLTK